jgi:hypothetical protein
LSRRAEARTTSAISDLLIFGRPAGSANRRKGSAGIESGDALERLFEFAYLTDAMDRGLIERGLTGPGPSCLAHGTASPTDRLGKVVDHHSPPSSNGAQFIAGLPVDI